MAVDLPGHGARAEELFTIGGAVDAVTRRSRRRPPSGRALVVGLSLGGYVAIETAEALPGPRAGPRARGLLRGAGRAVGLPFRMFAALMERVPPRALRVANRTFFRTRYRRAISEPIIAGGFWSAGGAQALRILIGRRYLERLGRLWTPVTIVNGTFDPVFGPGAEPWAAACRRGRHVLIAWALHLSNLDRPTTFCGSSSRRGRGRPGRRRPDARLTHGPTCRPAAARGGDEGRGYTRPHPSPCPRGSMRVRKAVFPAAGWGTRFLPATKAQPKEMLPLVDKPVIQYAVEEAVAAGIEQVIIVTSSQKRAIEDHFDLNYELEHLLEEKGEIEKLRQVRADQRPRPDRLRPPEGAAGPRPRGAHGQGPHRPRAVRRAPAGRRGHLGPAVHRPADQRLPPAPRVGRRRRGGAARGDEPLRRHRRRAGRGRRRWRPHVPRDLAARREAGARTAPRPTSRSSAATC